MRSDNVTKGAERAPNRSLFYALGYTPEDLKKPLIAVVSAHSDIVPGHMNLDKLTDAVKAGIEAAGGTPFMVPASMGPPEQTTAGTFIRTAAMTIPGTILSQLGTSTQPSNW